MSAMEASMAAFLTVISVLIGAVSAATYSNHTVGGASGWFFNATTDTSSTNYSTWAASQTFNLGDFLIFNTNTNHTVVQTYNSTSYNSCTADDDASDDDTLVFNSGATVFDQPLTIYVPLIKVGPNYFFSDAEDGVQCQRGMQFDIKVNQGLGLPPSLNQPPPPLYTPPPVVEPPPVFQGSGGGQGESIHNGVERVLGLGFGLIGLGLGLGLVF